MMPDLPDDVARRLGLPQDYRKEVEAEKLTNFETSSLAAVLKQLGWTPGQVAGQQRDLETGFGWDWFNDLGLVGARVGSTREFRFNFEELVTKPNQHPITHAFREFRDTQDDPKAPCCLIFHVYQHGRWVATNLTTSQDPSIHVVTPDVTFNVLTFQQFFARRWKED
jgi:hypothetical protein